MPPESMQEPEAAVIEHQQSHSEDVCPKCSSKMVKKTARKGKNVGNEFWACSAFPKCRHIEGINA
jgi:ssDNA-binding Zn-finger/Zn-ribbon topoisomerase 1